MPHVFPNSLRKWTLFSSLHWWSMVIIGDLLLQRGLCLLVEKLFAKASGMGEQACAVEKNKSRMPFLEWRADPTKMAPGDTAAHVSHWISLDAGNICRLTKHSCSLELPLLWWERIGVLLTSLNFLWKGPPGWPHCFISHWRKSIPCISRLNPSNTGPDFFYQLQFISKFLTFQEPGFA